MNKDFRNYSKRLLLIYIFFCIPVHADETAVSYGLGIRNDELRSAIATDLIGTPPNILSELTWRNLRGREDHFGLEYISSSGWRGRVSLNLAQFDQSGDVQDSDYQFDNRVGEFSRSLSATHGSNALDIALLMGKGIHTSDEDSFTIIPVIGLASNVIDLHMNEGNQIIAPVGFSTGPFSGLNSSYRTQFTSTVAGIETRWWFSRPFGLDLKWHHQWFTYHADADWNMRTDFAHPVSFNQDGEGVDNRWTLSVLARLNKTWTMELSRTIRRGAFQNGRDVLFLASGTQEHTLLREVEWSSDVTSLTTHYTF